MITDFLSLNAQKFENELVEFLSIASVSTDPDSAVHVASCAEWLKHHIQSIGIPNASVIATDGHPIVYAEYMVDPQKPTVLFYGHYDVQPVDPLNLWTNPPFEPTIRDGKIFARGATDDKGQVLLHIKALQALIQENGTLPCNVKLLIEGEEEIGSPNLAPFIRNNATMLACDVVVVSDTPMFSLGNPSIVYGLRGLAYMEITVKGPNRDLHSGSYGGAVQNPLNALATILSKLKNEDGSIAIPGFYSDVLEMSIEEREALNNLGYSDERLKADVQVQDLVGERGYSSVERLWARPTLDINGFIGGFTGVGAKTVLPSEASAKVSMRLVPHQDHLTIGRLFTEYVQSLAPKGVTVTVEDLHGANPVLVPKDTPAMFAAVKALEDTYGTECRFTREGGSIPVVLTFTELLSAPTVLMGFGLNNENAHSPDEHMLLENYHKGMLASARFYENMASINK